MSGPNDTDQQPQEEKIEKASFIASFPTNAAAITMRGDGSMKVIMEVPASDVANALALTMWTERALRVVVTPLKKNQGSGWKE